MTATTLSSALADIDRNRLVFALRTAVVACIALALATLLGLDHPQWAAMTVWVVAQPTRGQWIEKSLSRIAGSLFGVTVGLLLVVGAGDNNAVLLAGLVVWIGACAYAGNLLRGQVSYVALLSGYSAAMIAMLDHGHPELVADLAFDRILTILLGAGCTMISGLLFTPWASVSPLDDRIATLSDDLETHVADIGTGKRDAARQHDLLHQMALIDEMLDTQLTGSPRAHARARQIRRLLTAAMNIVSRGPRAGQADSALVAALQDFRRLRTSLENAPDDSHQTHLPALIPHRDWIGARLAALRAAGSVAAAGLVWLITDIEIGPFMVMGTAIMTSLFSTFDNPARQMRWGMLGSAIGGASALAAFFLIMPLGDTAAARATLMMPFILIGPLLMANRRTMMAGMDYCMVLLLLLNPTHATGGPLTPMLAQAFAVLTGPAIAFLAFSFAFPVDTARRHGFLVRLILSDLREMALGGNRHLDQDTWRMRLYHRILRLVRWSAILGRQEPFATDSGMAALEVGETILAIRRKLDDGAITSGQRRMLDATLRRLSQLSTDPQRAAATLARTGDRLQRQGLTLAIDIGQTAGLIRANENFFRAAG